MDDVVVGVLAVLIGALLCFRGYVTMRLIISLFGAFVGFLLGAGLAETAFGPSAWNWLVGIVGAVIFGLLAYISYQLAVVIGMAGIGFTIGTSLMALAGVDSRPTTLAVGVIAGIVLAVVAIAINLPAIILVILTALAGASVAVAGGMVILGQIGIDRLSVDGVTAQMATGWGWYVLYGALALLGAFSQFRAIRGRRRPMRSQWAASMPAPAAAP